MLHPCDRRKLANFALLSQDIILHLAAMFYAVQLVQSFAEQLLCYAVQLVHIYPSI